MMARSYLRISKFKRYLVKLDKNPHGHKYITLLKVSGVLLGIGILSIILSFVTTQTLSGGSVASKYLFAIGAGVLNGTLLLSIISLPYVMYDLRRNGVIKTHKYIGIVLLVLFGFFGWLYTYKEDKRRIYLHLLVGVLTLGATIIFSNIYALILAFRRPDSFYSNYDLLPKAKSVSHKPSIQ